MILSNRFHTLASDDMESDSSSLVSDKDSSGSTCIGKTSKIKHIHNGKETQQVPYRHSRLSCAHVDGKDHQHKEVVSMTSEPGKNQTSDIQYVGLNPDVHVVDEHFDNSQFFLREPNVGDLQTQNDSQEMAPIFDITFKGLKCKS